MKKIWTGKTLRDVAGVGSVIDPHHEGPTIKRPTEAKAGLDEFRGKSIKTPADFYREREERKAAEKKAAGEAEKERG